MNYSSTLSSFITVSSYENQFYLLYITFIQNGHFLNGLNFQRIKPVYSKNIQEYEKIFFATLFRVANNHNELFFHNEFKNFGFSQQKKFAKSFAEFLKLLQKFQQ